MIDLTKINKGISSLQIDKVVEKNNRLIFYYKERWNKNYKRLPLQVKDGYIIADFGKVNFRVKEYQLIETINNLEFGFWSLVSQYERLKKQEAKNKKNVKDKIKKEELLKITKVGDTVERIGKTPNLGLNKILVDKISDYGISGFYLFNDGTRSNEYTTVLWKYIKGKVVEVSEWQK